MQNAIQSGRILFDTDGRRESAETGQRRLRNLLALGQQQELVLAPHVGVDRHTWTKARQGKRPHFALRLLHMDRPEGGEVFRVVVFAVSHPRNCFGGCAAEDEALIEIQRDPEKVPQGLLRRLARAQQKVP